MTGPQPSTRPKTTYVEVALAVPLARTFTYAWSGEGAPSIGDAVAVNFHHRDLIGVVVGVSETSKLERVLPVGEVFDAVFTVDPDRMELARQVADYYGCGVGEVLRLMLPPKPGATARKSPLEVGADRDPVEPHDLTEDQAECVARIARPLDERSYASFLLHGVTGSGKTEVYLQLIERCLNSGRSALVLLPEIALTPQTIKRVRERFPGKVAPSHSRLTLGERSTVWEAAARGEARVLVGARSAVFAPMPDLGLIVVDEEHEPSFKSEKHPRYHARDVALLRAAQASVPVILGSATPSLESYHNASLGKHELLRLTDRVSGQRQMPTVRIVDRRDEGESRFEPLSPSLADAVRDAVDRGDQAILFHNRRGFARYLQCSSCGHVVECPRCDISLTWHLSTDQLRCHYCDHRTRRPKECTECSEEILDPRGTGTERVELALETRFPGARILRMDQDTTRRAQGHRRILEQFGRGDADILVGTQMVAKGLHFPRVTVVGVIDADQGLHFPDFRAHERAFQLLTQVSGRAGRGEMGEVFAQTLDPEHRVLRHIIDHDVDGFLADELEQRRALGYPPFRRLQAVTVTAPREDLLDEALDRLAVSLRHHLGDEDLEILGPARAVLARINRRYRGQMLVKGNLGPARKRWLVELFGEIRGGIKGGSRIDLALDVDPLHLL
jgi:primosomal protein N' (replication factor Y)